MAGTEKILGILFVFALICDSTIGHPGHPEVVTSELRVEVTPDDALNILTRDLKLNCSFTPEQESSFAILHSLIISKAGNDGNYSDLVSVTLISPNEPVVKASLNASVSGQIMVNEVAFLSLQWKAPMPSPDIVGRYRCEVRGMNNFGYHLISSTTADINENIIDRQFFIDKFETLEAAQKSMFEGKKIELETELESLKEEMQKDRKQLESLKHEVSKTNSQLESLLLATRGQMTTVNDFITRLNYSLSFQMSPIYAGHRYYVSQPMKSTAESRQNLCLPLGGYLAEINNDDEFDFVKEFLTATPGITQNIFIAGTDEKEEGIWRHTRTGKQLGYVKWLSGQPNEGTKANCIDLVSSEDFQMADKSCDNTRPRRNLCEVPV